MTAPSLPRMTRDKSARGKRMTASSASMANSRQVAVDTAHTVRMRAVSRLPQYWLISTTAPVARPVSPAFTKVVIALDCATAERALAPVRVTITLSAITTSRLTAL